MLNSFHCAFNAVMFRNLDRLQAKNVNISQLIYHISVAYLGSLVVMIAFDIFNMSIVGFLTDLILFSGISIRVFNNMVFYNKTRIMKPLYDEKISDFLFFLGMFFTVIQVIMTCFHPSMQNLLFSIQIVLYILVVMCSSYILSGGLKK